MFYITYTHIYRRVKNLLHRKIRPGATPLVPSSARPECTSHRAARACDLSHEVGEIA